MNSNATASKLFMSSPWTFFVVVFGWTWLFWILAAVLKVGMNSAAGLVLLLLGIIGPMLAGIGFTYANRDKDGRNDYWKRIIDFKRIGARWYLTIFLFVPILTAIAALLDIILGGKGGAWGDVIVNFLSEPWAIIPSALFSSLIPFIEELGWRGYLLDRLQARWNALASSLILGALWSLWHLPLFFIPDSYQHNLGIGTPEFWLFLIGIVPLNVVFSWIFNNTRRSTLAVILFHSMVNFTGELFAITQRADTFSILFWFVAATGVTAIWGAKTLVRKQ